MLKKLTEKIRNKQIKSAIDKLKFENFTYVENIEYPVFIVAKKFWEKNDKKFAPTNLHLLNSTIERLTKKYVKNTSIDEFAQLLETYFEYFNLNKSEIYGPLMTFMDKKEKLQEKSLLK